MSDHPSDHIALWDVENYQSVSERVWLVWIDKVEELLGCDPDGENSDAAKAAGTADGYSLDEFHDMWKQGLTPAAAVAQVKR